VQTIRLDTVHALNDRGVRLARQARVTQGRKLRIDGAVVETTIPEGRTLDADLSSVPIIDDPRL
jgi:hypothetical protein